MTIGNPISTLHNGSVSSLSNGAGGTTTLAGTLDRNVQRERENYTATVRSKLDTGSNVMGGTVKLLHFRYHISGSS